MDESLSIAGAECYILRMEKVVKTSIIIIVVLFLILFFRKTNPTTQTPSSSWAPPTGDVRENLGTQTTLYGNESKNHEKLLGILETLREEKSEEYTMNLIEGVNLQQSKFGVTYISIQKQNGCEFPAYGLMVSGTGVFNPIKSYQGIDISPSERFYFIQSRPGTEDSIQKLQYYLFQNPGNLCNSFIVNFFTEDFNKLLEPLRPKINEYRISIGQKDYDELLAGIPDESEDRYNSNFQFPSVKAELMYQSTIYDMKIKNRGGTSHHWANDKKSYTVNFKDYFKHSDKLLFYIPDKRAYTGEYLVNELAREIELPALVSGFAKLSINGKDQGVYYVSEDFDSLFLAKRDLPEANIYNTDPYQNPDKFTTEAVPKEMILSTLKDFKDAYDKDADYFLSVIKKDSLELQRNWKYHFDPDNLSKILALSSISGTAHYDFHNIVFYINPASGRIYFFPWDFMNYTHVSNLQREDLIDFPNDYLNVNQLFSQLLEIPEIRNMRNKAIYEYADILTDRLVQFEEDEHIGLITNFMADPTTAYYVGDGNKPSFVTYLQTPSILKNNIQYLKGKIESTIVTGNIDKTGRILLKSESFNGLKVRRLIIPDLWKGTISQIAVNNIPLSVKDYVTRQTSEGGQEIIFDTDIILSPKLTYKEEFATPIYLESGYMQIDLQNKSGTPLSVVAVEVENPATSHTQIIPLSTGTFFKAGDLPQVPVVSEPVTVNHPLLKEINSSTVTFTHSDVEITKDLVIPKGITLQIAPGTVVTFAEGVSLISYGHVIAQGTKKQPITFTAIDPKKPWGVVAILQEGAHGIFDYTIFEYGSDAKTNNRVYASGMLSGYYSDVTVTNSIFRYSNRNGGDDAVNIKYGKAVIQGNRFYENEYDGLDLDFVKKGSIVSGNSFEKNGNDGMDISGTTDLIIKNNRIRASGDKGISVGEDSHITVINNSIEDAQMGVAVKDNSTVILNHNNITNNSVGAAAYNKKELFGGGHIKVYNTLFKENKQDFGLESISKRDRRFLDQDYQSTIEAINSKYHLTGKETKELIKASEKKVSKRDTLETFLKGKLTTAKGTYATLKDTASRMKDYRLSDISNPIGTTK